MFGQVVVMNGCGSLFSCIAAVICDPKGKTFLHILYITFISIVNEKKRLHNSYVKSGHVL